MEYQFIYLIPMNPDDTDEDGEWPCKSTNQITSSVMSMTILGLANQTCCHDSATRGFLDTFLVYEAAQRSIKAVDVLL